MKQISLIMTQHHRDCDLLFSEMENAVSTGEWVRSKEACDQFCTNMLNHFATEEETIFPAFEELTGNTQGPTMVMKMEHEQMRALIDDLRQAVNQEDTDQVLGIADTVMLMIQQHNMKEEQVLYPMIDQVVSQPEELIQNFQFPLP